LLNLKGEKMSKSTGHFFAMEDVLKEFSGDVVRFYLLSTHFRSQTEFSRERLEDARKGFERLVNACRLIDENLQALVDAVEIVSPAAQELIDAAHSAREKFLAAMDDDFNSAGAIGHMFELVKRINAALEGPGNVAQSRPAMEAARSTIEEFDRILGLFHDGFPAAAADVPPEVQQMVDERQKARKGKDFQKADALRDRIAAAGWVVEDTPEGIRVKKR
jgi:cysteinyl-tRNA synthetase